MNVRKMLITDYDKVYELWMSCVGMGLNNLDDSREGIEKFLDRNEGGNAFWESQGFTVREYH